MLSEIKRDLNNMFIGREAEIDSLILAWLTNQNVLLIGKPGTGKSFLTKTFSEMIGCSKHYTHLMTKETSVSEIFGPFSIKSYKEDDRYIRIRKGTLLEAETADLDEIFKCNSATLNALLNALNERVYKEEGVEMPIPLRMVIGASNELPEGPELNALYDRFLFRHDVRNLDFEEREVLAARVRIPVSLYAATPEEARMILGTAQMAISQMVIPPEIRAKYWEICSRLKFTHGITVSERRDLQIFEAMKANAHMNGRPEVTTEDFSILEHMMWTKPDQRSKISDIVISVASPGIVEIRKLQDAMLDLRNRVDVAKGSYGVRDDVLLAINKDKNDILKRCEEIMKDSKSKAVGSIYENIVSLAGKIRGKLAVEMGL